MKLSDLHLGDVVEIQLHEHKSGIYLSLKGQGTIIGLDSGTGNRQVLVGWRQGDPTTMSDRPLRETCGFPARSDIQYLPNLTTDWSHGLWIDLEEVAAVITSNCASGAACSGCGYQNPYVNPPYVCSGCKLWHHLAS